MLTVDVDELCYLSTECASTNDLSFDLGTLEEALKTKILFDRSLCSCSSYFLTVVLNSVQTDDTEKDLDQIPVNDPHSFSVEEMDAIIGRTYNTRGVKRSYEEDKELGTNPFFLDMRRETAFLLALMIELTRAFCPLFSKISFTLSDISSNAPESFNISTDGYIDTSTFTFNVFIF